MSPTHEEVERLTAEYLRAVGEHCDAAQVLVTWGEDGATKTIKLGVGNWYARQGMAHDFIKSSEAHTAAWEIGEVMERFNPPDDEQDSFSQP